MHKKGRGVDMEYHLDRLGEIPIIHISLGFPGDMLHEVIINRSDPQSCGV